MAKKVHLNYLKICNHVLTYLNFQRLVCLVPHLFIYYFDNEQSESPRGIIDLEYFTNCVSNDEQIMTISPSEGVALRSFYFQIEEQNTLSDWMNALIRDRYHSIREERDMYQSMQSQFSSEINKKSEQILLTSQEKENMQNEIEAARETTNEAFELIKRLLAIVSVGDDDLLDPSACDSIGPASEALEKRIHQIRNQFDSKLISNIQVLKLCILNLSNKIINIITQI